jgi:hypothetical protein
MEVEDASVGWRRRRKMPLLVLLMMMMLIIIIIIIIIIIMTHAKYQASAAMYVRSAVFWVLTQCREVILCRIFGLNMAVVPKRWYGILRCVISQRSDDLNNNHDLHIFDFWPRKRNRKFGVFNGCHIVDVLLSLYVTDM